MKFIAFFNFHLNLGIDSDDIIQYPLLQMNNLIFKMKTFLKTVLLVLPVLLSQCVSDETKEKLNKAGNETGQTVGKFVSGVTNGVEKAFEAKITLSQNLKEKGIQFGKITVSSDSEGKDNLLIIYVIFNQDFKGQLSAKAFDNKDLEMGRTKMTVSGKKDDARFIEFHFDKHTNIDSDSKISIE
jgi:hypothetical protein